MNILTETSFENICPPGKSNADPARLANGLCPVPSELTDQGNTLWCPYAYHETQTRQAGRETVHPVVASTHLHPDDGVDEEQHGDEEADIWQCLGNKQETVTMAIHHLNH